jgi:hypothetical protein
VVTSGSKNSYINLRTPTGKHTGERERKPWAMSRATRDTPSVTQLLCTSLSFCGGMTPAGLLQRAWGST